MCNDPRFVSQKPFDPARCFDPELLSLARSCANGLRDHPDIVAMTGLRDIQKYIFEGSYFWITGPTYETKLECDILTQLGMDAVGMSTVPEFMAGSAIGMRTLGIGMVTDVMNRTEELSHAKVLAAAAQAVPVLKVLLLEIIKKLTLKQSIRDEIDSHILYKGDPRSIIEYPLVQPRELSVPTNVEVKEAAACVQRILGRQGVEMCYIFLNNAKRTEVIQHYQTCTCIPLKDLPHMPRYRASTMLGELVVGKLYASGLNSVSICNLDIDGFCTIESYFLSVLLKELGVTLVYVVIEGEWLLANTPALLPMADYTYRGMASQVNASVACKVGASHRVRINEIIRHLIPTLNRNPILFGFEGAVKPTPAEKLTAATLKADAYTLTSL